MLGKLFKNTVPLAAAVLLSFAVFAHADAGIPMIFVTLPGMALAFIPVYLIEALVIANMLQVEIRRTFWPSFWANLATTLIGIPLAWLLQLGFEFLIIRNHMIDTTTIPQKIRAVVVYSAWLFPYDWWVFPVALLLNLVPAYFVSIILEKLIIKRFFKESSPYLIHTAVTKANLCTYGGLAGICVLNIVYASVVHYHLKP